MVAICVSTALSRPVIALISRSGVLLLGLLPGLLRGLLLGLSSGLAGRLSLAGEVVVIVAQVRGQPAPVYLDDVRGDPIDEVPVVRDEDDRARESRERF